MKTACRVILIALIPVALSGCGGKNEEPEGVIPEGYKNAVNKAENVEELLMDTHQKRLKEAD